MLLLASEIVAEPLWCAHGVKRELLLVTRMAK